MRKCIHYLHILVSMNSYGCEETNCLLTTSVSDNLALHKMEDIKHDVIMQNEPLHEVIPVPERF